MRHLTCLLFFLLIISTVSAQGFDSFFEDKTLRLDYIFSGTATEESVSLHELNTLSQWAGRRSNLAQLARDGNGQIIVRDSKTNNVIYKESFSSLFQEWQSTEEAQNLNRSFENVFLIPFPKAEINVEVLFRQRDGDYKSILSHRINPQDILIRQSRASEKYVVLHEGGDVSECINIAIVPEGYSYGEVSKFEQHAIEAVAAILSHEPFGKYRDRLNFFAPEPISEDSGVSIPRENDWKNTLVSSHFDTFYSDRYLTTSHVFDLHNALAITPYSHIIILANTETYGGGGIFNSYTLTTTGHKDFSSVVVHEFGHSFGGLADEYYYEGGDIFDSMYSLDVEPWEPNITTLVNFDSKWNSQLPKGTPIPTPADKKYMTKNAIGVFEGAGYVSKGIYRPAIDCRMKTNTCEHFCPACQSAIEQIIRFYTE